MPRIASFGIAYLLLAFAAQGGSLHEAPPNIVIIFCDDVGYADIGCFGAKGWTTPNIDRMAEEGLKLTSFYASTAVCSASRASLLSGCYPPRLGVYGAYSSSAKTLPDPDEELISELLKERNYQTAIVGKWHLGHREPFLPLQSGFDEYLGLPYSNDMWPIGYDGGGLPPDHWKAKAHPPLPLIDGNKTVDHIETLDDQGTLTTRYTERAVDFIDRAAPISKRADNPRPFFLYFAHTMTHVPLGVSDKFAGKSEQGLYGDCMMEIDWSVGEVLSALKRGGVDDNTLVIFTSDNGPWLNYGDHAGSAFPLREGKGSMWEGGCRVPFVARWPGRIEPGRVSAEILSTIDLLPTIAALTGARTPTREIDGIDASGFLTGRSDSSPRDTFLYYYGRKLRAVRQGKWKLHVPHEYRNYEGLEPANGGWPGPTRRGRTSYELYDLESDMQERRNVADLHPDVVEQLKQLADEARAQLGDADRRGSGQRDPVPVPWDAG